MRARMQEAQSDKQRLEKTISEFRTRRYSTESDFRIRPRHSRRRGTALRWWSTRAQIGPIRLYTDALTPRPSQPLRPSANAQAVWASRTVLATEGHKPPSEDALLLELVSVKTSEAVARQELEEVKGKLDSLRKMLGGGPSPTSAGGAASGSST